MDQIWIIGLIFFAVATIYASVGFGGGSSYLAILALFSFGSEEMRFIALICNCMVVIGSLINFYRAKLLNLRSSLPLVLLSVPFAFLGGTIQLEEHIYFVLLGVLLISVSVLMMFRTHRYRKTERSKNAWVQNAGTGGVIGLVSGLVGIGGGVFLSPVLHVQQWAKPKVIAATCSLFILVNSLAGLFGQSLHFKQVSISHLVVLIIAVIFGGQIGNRLSIKVLNPSHVKLMTAILVLYVGIRILIKYL